MLVGLELADRSCGKGPVTSVSACRTEVVALASDRLQIQKDFLYALHGVGVRVVRRIFTGRAREVNPGHHRSSRTDLTMATKPQLLAEA